MAKHTADDRDFMPALLTLLMFCVVVLLAVICAFCVLRYDAVVRAEAALPFLARETASVSADDGVAYILAQEALDPAEVDEALREARQAELEAIRAQREAELAALREQQAEEIAAMRARRLEDMMNGTTDVWPLFADYVLIGDSRVVGFSYYGFLPESRVIAELGATILGVSDKLWQIHQVDPAYICLSFGANDLITYRWPTGPEFAARYRELVALLQSEFPDALIVVNSIPAIRESSLHTQSIYYQVPEFNEALRAMCAEAGAVFVDNDAIADAHTDLYAGDGIHFAPGFYPYWGANILEAVIEYEEGELIDIDESALPALDEADLRDMEQFGLLDAEP